VLHHIDVNRCKSVSLIHIRIMNIFTDRNI